jgi:hypothetical protein
VVVPGKYQVRLTVGAQAQTVPLEVKLDPRVKVSQSDLEQQLALLLQIRDQLNLVNDTVNQIEDVRSQLRGLKLRLPENANENITHAADDLDKKLTALRENLINLTISANEDSLAYAPQIDAKLAFLAMHVGSADAAPTESEQQELRNLKQQSQELQARWAELQKSDLAAFQRLASESSLSTVVVPPRGRVLERETQEKQSGSTQEEQK